MAGYRSWTDQDRLTSADLNNFLMAQTAPRFSDADDRDAQMGGVVPGQLSYLVDTDTYYRVSRVGTWVELIPAPPVAPPAPRAGTAVLNAATVTVPAPAVTAASVIVLTAQSLPTGATPPALAVSDRTAGASFTISTSVADGSAVGWLLIEPT